MSALIAAAGQQFYFNFAGESVTPEVARFAAETRPGGVVLFARNLRSAAQARRLNQELQRLAADLGLPPFVVAIDEEGGRVSRMPGDLAGTIMPSPMAQAAAGGPAAAARGARATARRLRYLGLTMNFAPVADVNNNPANPVIGSRSYGADPARVAACVAAAVEAYLGEGISPCAKHFPGHGDTSVDSHFGLPVLDKPAAEIQGMELVPFAAAIRAGVPAIMTAHIIYPRIDPSGRPATLSPAILRGMLREKLGFEGLIFTDALDMKAIADNYGLAEATRLALAAGAALLAPVGSLDTQYECYRALARAAEEGEFDARAEAARVAEHKARWVTPRLGTLAGPLPVEEFAREVAEEEATALEVAQRSLAVLRDLDGLLPIDPSGVRRAVLVDFALPVAAPAEEARRPGPALEAALRAYLSGLEWIEVAADPSEVEAAEALRRAHRADLIVVVTRNAVLLPAQAALAGRLMSLGGRSIVVAARDPYDLAAVPGARAVVATYGDPPASMRAVPGVLFGEVRRGTP